MMMGHGLRDRRAVLGMSMDIGFFTLWTLLKSSYKIHVLWVKQNY